MTGERLDSLFSSPVISHVLVFNDATTGRELGCAALYIEEPEVAFYYYAFYDLEHPNKSLGMYMMTSAVEMFRARGFAYVYLGSCYTASALYKTQFAGIEFFNGYRWSPLSLIHI